VTRDGIASLVHGSQIIAALDQFAQLDRQYGEFGGVVVGQRADVDRRRFRAR
jgi:hypothetical protein